MENDPGARATLQLSSCGSALLLQPLAGRQLRTMSPVALTRLLWRDRVDVPSKCTIVRTVGWVGVQLSALGMIARWE